MHSPDYSHRNRHHTGINEHLLWRFADTTSINSRPTSFLNHGASVEELRPGPERSLHLQSTTQAPLASSQMFINHDVRCAPQQIVHGRRHQANSAYGQTQESFHHTSGMYQSAHSNYPWPLAGPKVDWLDSGRAPIGGLARDYRPNICTLPPESMMQTENSLRPASQELEVAGRPPSHSSSIGHFEGSVPQLMTGLATPPALPNEGKLPWSPTEDEKLLQATRAVQEVYDDPLPWTRVADMLANRTAVMCARRYRVLMRPRQSRERNPCARGPWSKDEDVELMRAVAAHTEESTAPIPRTRIGSSLKKRRSGLQACARYTEALDKSVKKGRWSKVEDAILLEQWRNLGPSWSVISAAIPGRTQRQCASRFGSLQKWWQDASLHGS